jgi:hypothetical protein
MLRNALLLALISPPDASCPPQPDRVFLGAVVTNPVHYGRVIETCGLVQGIGDLDSRERILHDATGQHDGYWMYVFNGEGILPPEGTRTCIVGIFRRRDGFSPAEARARGLPDTHLIDGLQRPDYVFYPVQCAYDGPALG